MRDLPPWRVSAVIPSYNRAGFLPETIGCLLAQTAPPHEIIVVDDGSTDDTAAVVAAFGSAVRYVKIGNSGAPVARNVGAALATGDWLWFCDSDDLWLPTYLERCRQIATTAPHPQVLFGNFSLVVGDVWEETSKFATAPAGFWEGIGTLPAPGGAIFPRPLYGAILTFQPVFHSTIVMSRDFFYAVGGYDPTFARTGSEDFEFTLRCMGRAPIGMVEEPLVGIRRHRGNFSQDHLRALLGELDILRHAKARHDAAAQYGALIDAEITRRTLQAVNEAFAGDQYACVRALAATLAPADIDPRSAIKIRIAELPHAVRSPVVSLARLKNGRRAASR